MVEARHVSKVYKSGPAKVVALDSVDLVVGRGQMVAVMGPSGSGKTTLLNCLSGLDEISSGEVFVEGARLAGMSDAKRTKYRARRMGFVFQAFNLLPVFSAVENVELPLLLGGIGSGEARKRAIDALVAVGLGERARHRPAELSAGEQQRVALARAIAPDPAVLWADEPTGNLDTENAERVIQLIKQLNVERNLTILLVTHDQHIAGWAERLLHMRDGRIIG
jgi:putative ABC transport system ATP-binding protein